MTDPRIISEFIMDIINGKYTFGEVQQKIRSLENQYGTEFFPDYEISKKDKPWDQNYLDELEQKSICGMTSKQFILHLAEVSEYVHTTEKAALQKRRRMIIAGIVAAVIIAAVIIILCVSKSDNSAQAAFAYSQTMDPQLQAEALL